MLTVSEFTNKLQVQAGSSSTDYQWAPNIAFKRTSVSTSATGSLPSVGRFLFL